MRPILSGILLTALLPLFSGCGRNDRDNANSRTAQAQEKARAEGQRLREDARRLDHNIHQALTGPASSPSGASQSADEKLRRGADDLRVAGSQAAVKLDHAALVAKVKTTLATNIGVSTVTGIEVEASGSVVTLRGTVASDDQKRRAGEAAGETGGVTKVINELRVQP